MNDKRKEECDELLKLKRKFEDLEEQYDELEERYKRKRNVASFQQHRADTLAEELASARTNETKHSMLDDTINNQKESENAAKRKLDRCEQEASQAKKMCDKQTSEIESLKGQLAEKEVEIKALKDKPQSVTAVVQTDIAVIKGSELEIKNPEDIKITLPQLAHVSRKAISTKLLVSRHFKKNILKATDSLMQQFEIHPDSVAEVRTYLAKDLNQLRKKKQSLKEEGKKLAQLIG